MGNKPVRFPSARAFFVPFRQFDNTVGVGSCVRNFPKKLFLAVFVAVCTLCLPGCGKELPGPSESPVPATQQSVEKAPAAVRKLLKENGLSGKVVLVKFGAVGCPQSGVDLVRMIDMYNRGDIAGLFFIRLEGSREDDRSKSYFEEKTPPFPVVYDPKKVYASALGTLSYPAFALVDTWGRVRFRGSKFPEKNLAEWTTALCAETEDPGSDALMFGVVKLDYPALMAGTRLAAPGREPGPLAEYAGKNGLVIFFTGTFCSISGGVLKNFQPVANGFKAHGINSVVVYLKDPMSKAATSFVGYGLTIPFVVDPTTATEEAWHADVVPKIVYVDAAMEGRYYGTAEWDKVARAAENALGLAAGTIQFTEKGSASG